MNIIDFVARTHKHKLQEAVLSRLIFEPIISRTRSDGSLVIVDTIDARRDIIFVNDYTDDYGESNFEITLEDLIGQDWKYGRCLYGFTRMEDWTEFSSGTLSIFVKIDGDINIIREKKGKYDDGKNISFVYGERGGKIYGFYPNIHDDGNTEMVKLILDVDELGNEHLTIETVNVNLESGLCDVDMIKDVDDNPTHWYINSMYY